ncbi:MAG: DUF5110 domain-containing protein [Lachnoclostridium sp.]|nr:DUF5110 domain-containing protein [Lachnoclostridium sp.]
MANEKRSYYYKGKEGFYRFSAVCGTMRCVYAKTRTELDAGESLMIVPDLTEAMPDIKEDAASLQLSHGGISLEINKSSESFSWRETATGRLLLEEAPKELFAQPVTHYDTDGEEPVIKKINTVDGERNFIQNLKSRIVREVYRAKLNFRFKKDEHIYGLGQGEEGQLNRRKYNQYLYQHNMKIPMPFLLSNAGWGLLADCTSLMTFNDDCNGTYLFMDAVERLDYYFIAGSADDVIAGYRKLTGRAAMLPKWTFGYVQSKESYHTANELLSIAEEYRRRQVGLDCVVQDWNTWVPGLWGEKQLDPKRYADMPQVSEKLHDMNIHTMISVWPNMAEGGKNHSDFARENLLLSDYSTYDAFNPAAREMYWQQAKSGLFDKGFDSWWCDSTEPFSGPDWNGAAMREPWERWNLVGGEHKRHLDPTQTNAFALQHARGMYEGQRRDVPEKRILNLTRSGYAGLQRYGTVLWSGDISATWDVLKKQIAEGLNMCMSGIPYWTLDIGGFFVVGTAWQKRGCGSHENPNPLWFWKGEYNDGVDDPDYCELYIRWFQLGTFLPMQRSHGTDTPREIWQFGEEGTPYYDAIKKYIELRYALMPYIYSLAGRTTQAHYTMFRSLLFDFPHDETALKQTGAFMFGPAFLVYPVTSPKQAKWSCYLPQGSSWVNYWTAETYEGGQIITADAPLDTLPLFVRAGSIVPKTPGIQYADEPYEKPMELHVYPGADGTFTLYEDSGDGYGYENGAFSEIEFTWHDETYELSIDPVKGGYPGMPVTRCFTVICGEKQAEVTYDGFMIIVSL